MKRFQFLITILLSIFIFTSLVYAQPCRQKGMTGMGMGMGMGTGMCAPWLNLTAEQQKQITSLHTKYGNELAADQRLLQKKQLSLKGLLLEDKVDTEKAYKLQKEISGLSAKIEMESLKNTINAYNILTPEQRNQLPAGCSLGFGRMNCGQRPCMSGKPMGPCRNMGMGRGMGQGWYR